MRAPRLALARPAAMTEVSWRRACGRRSTRLLWWQIAGLLLQEGGFWGGKAIDR